MTQHFWSYFAFFWIVLLVHLIGFNQIGRTWDEEYKLSSGFIGVQQIIRGNFSLEAWNDSIELPIIAKYIYGFFWSPHLTYINGPYGQANLSENQLINLRDGNYIQTNLIDTTYAATYDFTLPRLVSAFFNSAAIILSILIARFILPFYWSFLVGVFLLFTPRFLFLGQLVTFESITLFLFCLTILVFYKLLNNPSSIRLYMSVGLLSGLLFWIRYNNVVVFLFLFGWLILHYFIKRDEKIFNPWLFLIPVVAILFGIITWPLMWHGFPKYLIESITYHEKRLIGISWYYWKYLLVTTPIPIIIGFCIGLFYSIRKHSYWFLIFIWWIVSMVVFFSILSVPTGGTRYVVMLYPVITILSVYGFYLIFKKKWKYVLVPVILFLVFEQLKIFPYYLDYYNHIIGGTKGAIEKNYEFSWWGEGQKEAGEWINKNAKEGSSVGLIVTPKYVFPRIRIGLNFKGYVDEKSDVDYIVVTRGDEKKLSKEFFNNRKVVYEVKADREALLRVMKKKD